MDFSAMKRGRGHRSRRSSPHRRPPQRRLAPTGMSYEEMMSEEFRPYLMLAITIDPRIMVAMDHGLDRKYICQLATDALESVEESMPLLPPPQHAYDPRSKFDRRAAISEQIRELQERNAERRKHIAIAMDILKNLYELRVNVLVRYPYYPSDPREIPLYPHEHVEVFFHEMRKMEQPPDRFYLGRKSDGTVGWFPKDYLHFLNAEDTANNHYSNPVVLEALRFMETPLPAAVPVLEPMKMDEKTLVQYFLALKVR